MPSKMAQWTPKGIDPLSKSGNRRDISYLEPKSTPTYLSFGNSYLPLGSYSDTKMITLYCLMEAFGRTQGDTRQSCPRIRVWMGRNVWGGTVIGTKTNGTQRVPRTPKRRQNERYVRHGCFKFKIFFVFSDSFYVSEQNCIFHIAIHIILS